MVAHETRPGHERLGRSWNETVSWTPKRRRPELGREFFAAIDARDPRRLRRRWPRLPFEPSAPGDPSGDEIVAYFGTVVSSYPTARWEVTDVISDGERAAVQFTLREFASHLGRELISEQVAIVRTNAGKITSIVGYYDSSEFREQFWSDSVT